jgi:hypothetical protein
MGGENHIRWVEFGFEGCESVDGEGRRSSAGEEGRVGFLSCGKGTCESQGWRAG